MASIAPLIVIVGPTASGKSALALQIAKECSGEIICADSRTVYQGMDIGTAKPSPKDRTLVPHHLLDIVRPDESFTVADFQKMTNAVITEIVSRGNVPIMVGGTGLYIDSVLYNFSFRPTDETYRQELELLSIVELQQKILDAGYSMPLNEQNPRHLVRTLESRGETMQRQVIRSNTLVLGMQPDKEILDERIARRAQTMIDRGLEAEVRSLFDRYGRECRALRTIGYQEFLPYFDGLQTLDDVTRQIILSSKQYAKRQHTWFKRNKSTHWLQEQIEYVDLVTTFLNKK